MAISIIEIDGTEYQLGASASDVAFNNSQTGLESGSAQGAIAELAESKQDKLTPGDGVSISNGVISFSGGGSGADGGDAADADVLSACDNILT